LRVSKLKLSTTQTPSAVPSSQLKEVTIMFTKTGVALATLLVVGVSSNAMAQRARTDGMPRAANQEIIEDGSPVTLIAAHKPARSAHSRLRQSRDAGLRTGGYSQAPVYEQRGPLDFSDSDDNYQYWHQACCL
jgi:hypothetical protein